MDDYQIDRNVPEPTTYGYTLGFKFEKPANILQDIYLEYSRVANRTYQTYGEFGQENYVHRNYPIGHYLGNDFESMLMLFFFKSYNYFGLKNEPALKISMINSGANDLYTPWDSPWNDENNLQDGVFYENFPSSPSEVSIEGELLLKSLIGKSSYLEIGLKYDSADSKSVILMGRYKIVLDKNFKY